MLARRPLCPMRTLTEHLELLVISKRQVQVMADSSGFFFFFFFFFFFLPIVF